MSHDLGREKVGRLLLQLSLPAILSMVTAAVYNLADRIFVGQLNPLGLTAIGITMPFQIIQMALVLMIGVGSSTLISVSCGRGEMERAQAILESAFWYFVVTQALLSILGIWLMDPIFRLLRISAETYPYARTYTLVLLLGGVPGLTGYCLNNAVRALGHARASMIFVIASSALNIVLDALFVWWLRLDVFGAALATIISESLVTVCVLWFFLRHPIEEGWQLRRMRISALWHRPELLRDISVQGLPNFYMQIFATAVNTVLNRSVLSYGNDYDMAAMTIIASLSQFFLMAVYGIGQGAQPIVGFNYGAAQPQRSRECLRLAMGTAVSLMLLVVVLVLIFPGQLVGLFTSDEALVQLTVPYARICLSILPLVAVHSIGTTFLQSIQRPREASFLYILRFGAVLLPSVLLLPRLLGISGVYLASALSDGLSGLAAAGLLLYFFQKQGGEIV